MTSRFAGVDIGGTKLLACATDPTRGPDRWAQREVSATVCAADLTSLIHTVITELRADQQLVGVGVGYPGLVEPSDGGVRSSVILPAVGAVPLAAMVSSRLGVPCRVDNDVNCAARAEAARRPRTPDFLFLAAGTGVGGALVLDGQVRTGARGLAGEVGHITIRNDGAACPCGGFGCVHLYAGGRVIEQELGLPAGGLRHVDLDTDARACEEVERAGWALGVGAANAVAVLDVPLVVIGGGLASIGPLYLDAIRAGFRSSAMTEFAAGCRIELARAGPDAGAEGAALLALRAWSPEA